jgi:hypothetical protein
LAIANKLYINARASAARFTHNVTAAGQQPRQAPAAAIGWAAGVPCAWRAGVRAIGAAVGPAPSGRGPWGTVRGAALRRACVNRRPMDGQQRPRWPRAAGMFQPGIMKTKFFLPMISNNIILYHAGRCCRAIKKAGLIMNIFENKNVNCIKFSVGNTIENSLDFDTFVDAVRFAHITDEKHVFVHMVICDILPVWENMCLKKSGEFTDVILAQIKV